MTKRLEMSDARSATDAEQPAVLIVDDIEANLKVLGVLLERLPCRVIAASSGAEALEALRQGNYAVMLLDVQMPEMDGYEVARRARLNPATRDVPIIFLTATHDSETNVARGYGSGAVDFLFKPLDSVVLLSKVRVFLELHEGRYQLAEANRQLAEANRQLEARNVELRDLAEAEAVIAKSFRHANEQLQEAYRDLQATQAQLVQSAKMASLGELVAGVAHEINNPLAFVLSHMDTARKSLERFRVGTPNGQPEAAEEHWQRAQVRLAETELGLTRIRDLVLKLRTLSRLDEGERKVVSIAECFDAVLTIMAHRIRDRIDVVTDFGQPDTLECYAGPMNQVLLNLVVNAVDAIQERGTIAIKAGPDGDAFAITIVDTGPGIPPDLRERVLEPFFTTKPVGQGTGLGLSIAHSIIKKHAGTLVVDNAPHGGASISIRVPLRQK